MRTKKGKPLAAPDLKTAWANFYASTKEEDLAAYAAQGWKTVAKIAEESGMSINSIAHQMQSLVQQKKFEKKLVRAKTGNGVREVAIFRPLSQRRANSHAKH